MVNIPSNWSSFALQIMKEKERFTIDCGKMYSNGSLDATSFGRCCLQKPSNVYNSAQDEQWLYLSGTGDLYLKESNKENLTERPTSRN
ncbi:unnamed protein product [Adineta ricciae]|uniref:Uncharacterized protein n=1 Tax=Adineta ricciae TaxID=249248 RepID=A0A815DXB4_ADIRI|nr:unnamed protein product [Adineta ricciae]